MARDMVVVMEHLGFPRFCVAGHDRGGRVAYPWLWTIRSESTDLPFLTYFQRQPSGIEPTRALRWPTGHRHCLPSQNPFQSASSRRHLRPLWTMRLVPGAPPQPSLVPRFVRHMSQRCGTPFTPTPFVKSIERRQRSIVCMTTPTPAGVIEYPARSWRSGAASDHSSIGIARRADRWRSGKPGAMTSGARALNAGHFFPEELPNEAADALGDFLGRCPPPIRGGPDARVRRGSFSRSANSLAPNGRSEPRANIDRLGPYLLWSRRAVSRETSTASAFAGRFDNVKYIRDGQARKPVVYINTIY
jgi:hypothetical protein